MKRLLSFVAVLVLVGCGEERGPLAPQLPEPSAARGHGLPMTIGVVPRVEGDTLHVDTYLGNIFFGTKHIRWLFKVEHNGCLGKPKYYHPRECLVHPDSWDVGWGPFDYWRPIICPGCDGWLSLCADTQSTEPNGSWCFRVTRQFYPADPDDPLPQMRSVFKSGEFKFPITKSGVVRLWADEHLESGDAAGSCVSNIPQMNDPAHPWAGAFRHPYYSWTVPFEVGIRDTVSIAVTNRRKDSDFLEDATRTR